MDSATLSSARPRARVPAYDALRVFAIASVVAIHVVSVYRPLAPPHSPVRLFDDMLHYAVPLFVFVSGALLWSRPWPRSPGSYRRFIGRRAVAVLVPYAFWFAVYAAGFVWVARDRLGALTRLPLLFLSGNVSYHLYFVPMLFALYLLTPVASRIAEKSPEALFALAWLIGLLAGPTIDAAAGALGGAQLQSFAVHVTTHLPDMALGAWFALRLPRIPRAVRLAWPAPLALGSAILLASYAGWLSAPAALTAGRLAYSIGMPLTLTGMALAAEQLVPHRDSALLTRASALSFGVYFVHPLFLYAIVPAVAALGGVALWQQWWLPVLVWAGVLAASYASAAALAATNATAWTIGVRTKERAGPADPGPAL